MKRYVGRLKLDSWHNAGAKTHPTEEEAFDVARNAKTTRSA
jgi:hypothetical protein